MTLDPVYSVGVGFFVFRAVVRVALYEPEKVELEDSSVLESAHYLRTYGITAESFGAAAEMAEELGGRSPDDKGEPDGWLDGIELELIDPETVGEAAVLLAPLEQRGINFVSGRIFCSETEDDS